MVKLIQLSSRDGLEEPLQAITKARVWLELSGLAVDGNRHVAVDHFERPLRRHVLHLIVPAQGQMAKAADRSRFE
jgi:hypothetical protein